MLITSVCLSGLLFDYQISATIKDNKVKSTDGFNLNVAVPFKFEDVLFGFKYGLDNVSLAPESLFFRKSMATAQDGVLTVDGDYVLGPNKLGVAARWVSNKLGLDVGARVDSQSYLTNVDVTKTVDIDGRTLTVLGEYDVRRRTVGGAVGVQVDNTNLAVAYDGRENDVTLSVSQRIDDSTSISPFVNSKAHFGLSLLRKWSGGHVRGKYCYPTDRISVEWTDAGSNGAWTTKADIPVKNVKQTKVSLTRDWDF